jgi:hypothetical protein
MKESLASEIDIGDSQMFYQGRDHPHLFAELTLIELMFVGILISEIIEFNILEQSEQTVDMTIGYIHACK